MHIYLMGYRGSGKTTIARLLAQVIDKPFVDTDDWIEATTHQSIREIFGTLGEDGFRDIESEAIAQVSQIDRTTVVALGGGAILRESNRQLISKTGLRIWLRASPDRLYHRIQNDSNTCDRRPSLTDQSGFEEVVTVLAERSPIYETLANLIVDTDGRTPDEVVEVIAHWLRPQLQDGQ